MTNVIATLERKGWVTMEESTIEAFNDLVSRLGIEILRTEVRLKTGTTAGVFSSAALDWHQDSPQARWMAWFCVNPGTVSIPTEILSLDEFKKLFATAELNILSKINVREMSADGQISTRPLFDGSKFYYCPWLVQHVDRSSQKIFEKFRALLISATEIHCQRWTTNQIMVIDNHRFLHRRAAVDANTSRHLIRAWVAESESQQ